ncbi:hypothetical protein [Streptosporangium subroseum]|uniref:hypothetical protein n=1 Tax=Streptosporangium subroseum TaxID=106412 RepID=UPI00308A5348|nr:hypothetical protein OHB15_18855 [Streptosporangium subroseum]
MTGDRAETTPSVPRLPRPVRFWPDDDVVTPEIEAAFDRMGELVRRVQKRQKP